MLSLKLKFRPSTVDGKEGSLFFQVIFNRIVRQVNTGYKIYDAEWNSAKSAVVNGIDANRNVELALIRDSIRLDIERMNRIMAEFQRKGVNYEIDDVITEFQRVTRESSLFNFMTGVISRKKRGGKIRTAEIYRDVLNSFSKFRNGRDIMLDAITSDEMVLYESFLTNRGVCRNTVSFYMRVLRATYNRAVERGLIQQRYPFKHVFTGICKTKKRAITIRQIRRVKQLDLSKSPVMSLARDIFLFSFYTRGMSFVDMANLRKSDVQNGVISYRRHKTGQLLTIKVESCTQEIIDRYSSPDSIYVFPIIKDKLHAYNQYKNALRLINNKLKAIGRMLGISIKLTTYVGRHSWGNAAKCSNIPISVISESMGHDNERTTQIYLASLDTSVIDHANAKILKKL